MSDARHLACFMALIVARGSSANHRAAAIDPRKHAVRRERASDSPIALAKPGPFGECQATTTPVFHRVPGPSATP